MKLIQENGNEKRIFTLIDNGMKIHESSKLGEINRTIPFELISNDFVKLNFNPIQWVIIFVIIVLLIISVFFLKLFGIEGEGKFYYYLIIALLGGISSILSMRSKETVLSCYETEGIEFFKDKPSKGEFDAFITKLFQRRNKVLKKKYAFVSEFLTFDEQLEKFNLLHALGIIELEEFNKLKEDLNNLIDKNNGDFNFNPN